MTIRDLRLLQASDINDTLTSIALLRPLRLRGRAGSRTRLSRVAKGWRSRLLCEMPLRGRRIAEEVAEVLCRCGEMTLLKKEADVVRTAACGAGGKAPRFHAEFINVH